MSVWFKTAFANLLYQLQNFMTSAHKNQKKKGFQILLT